MLWSVYIYYMSLLDEIIEIANLFFLILLISNNSSNFINYCSLLYD